TRRSRRWDRAWCSWPALASPWAWRSARGAWCAPNARCRRIPPRNLRLHQPSRRELLKAVLRSKASGPEESMSIRIAALLALVAGAATAEDLQRFPPPRIHDTIEYYPIEGDSVA